VSGPHQPEPEQPVPNERVTAASGPACGANSSASGEPRTGSRPDPAQLQHAAGLAEAVERAWTARIAGQDPGLGAVLAGQLDALRAELTAPGATPLEQLLINRVAVSWLQCLDADAAALVPDAAPAAARLALQRQDRAQRRHLDAIRMLTLVRKLLRPAGPGRATATPTSPRPTR
jgi:hypothetical protein